MARKIEIEVTGDTRSLERALSSAGRTTESSFRKMGRAAGVAGLAIAGGLAVAAKIGFDELSQMAQVSAQTEAVLKSTGGQANVTAAQVDKLATSIAAYSGQDDEAVKSAQNLLLTFRNVRNEAGDGAQVFTEATKSIADLAQAMGMDLQSAALQVGKALNDPVAGMSRLTRIGVTFNDQQKKTVEALVATGDTAGAQAVILEELNKEFGGSARAFGQTLPGKLKIAQESFKNLSGELMLTVLPALTQLAEVGLRFSRFLQENPQHAKAMVIALGALSAALLTASAAQMALNLAVLANPYVAAAVAVIALGAALVVLYKKFEFVRKHWQLLLIGFGVAPVVIATVVKAIIRHWDSIRGPVNAVRNAVIAAWEAVSAATSRVWGAIVADIRAKIAVIRTVFATVKSAATASFGAVRTAVLAVVSAIQTVIGWINTLIGKIQSIPTPGDVLGGIAGRIPGFDHGGVVPGPVGAPRVIMAHGGETVLPTHRDSYRSRGSTMSFPAARGAYVILADQEFVDFLRAADGRERRRNGGRGIL